jgi:hypothetical protein
VQTITLQNALQYQMSFATGPTGNITQWLINVDVGSLIIVTHNEPGIIQQDFGTNGDGSGQIRDNPGTWTTGGIVPDTGSTIILMTLTLMALGVAARQFKRAAA